MGARAQPTFFLRFGGRGASAFCWQPNPAALASYLVKRELSLSLSLSLSRVRLLRADLQVSSKTTEKPYNIICIHRYLILLILLLLVYAVHIYMIHINMHAACMHTYVLKLHVFSTSSSATELPPAMPSLLITCNNVPVTYTRRLMLQHDDISTAQLVVGGVVCCGPPALARAIFFPPARPPARPFLIAKCKSRCFSHYYCRDPLCFSTLLTSGADY